MFVSLLIAVAGMSGPAIDQSVYEAIKDEIQESLEATETKDIERYMETVPADYRIVEEDGSITSRSALRAQQLQAWAIVPKTNSIEQTVDGFQLSCDGSCATVWTNQKWDRQMLGRDGRSIHNVVTTQRHSERWEQRASRWVRVSIKELGGTVMVDGKLY